MCNCFFLLYIQASARSYENQCYTSETRWLMGSILISHLHLPPTPEEFLNNDLLQLLDPSQDPTTGVVVESTPPPTRYPNCPPAFPFEAPPSVVVPPWSWRKRCPGPSWCGILGVDGNPVPWISTCIFTWHPAGCERCKSKKTTMPNPSNNTQKICCSYQDSS